MQRQWLILLPLTGGGAIVGALAGQSVSFMIGASVFAVGSGISGVIASTMQHRSQNTYIERQLQAHERHISQLEQRLALKDQLIQQHESFQHHFVSRVNALSQRALPQAPPEPPNSSNVPEAVAAWSEPTAFEPVFAPTFAPSNAVEPSNVLPFVRETRPPEQAEIIVWLQSHSGWQVESYGLVEAATPGEAELATLWYDNGWHTSIPNVLSAIASDKMLQFRDEVAAQLWPIIQNSGLVTHKTFDPSTRRLKVRFCAKSESFWRGGWLRCYTEQLLLQAQCKPILCDLVVNTNAQSYPVTTLFWWQSQAIAIAYAPTLTAAQLSEVAQQRLALSLNPEQAWVITPTVPDEAISQIRDRYHVSVMTPHHLYEHLTPISQAVWT